MKEKINFLEELNKIKNLFVYKRGVVISEQKKIISEDFDFGKYPCINTNWKKQKTATGTNIDGPTKLGVEMVNGQGEEFVKYPLGNQTFYMKDIRFAENGDWYQGGYGRGTFACVNGKITLYDNSGKQLTLTSNKQNTKTTGAQVTPKYQTLQNVTVKSRPNALRTIEDIKKFQDWLDQNKGTWAYSNRKRINYKVEKKEERGYGNYGPNTEAAWKKYGDEYLNSINKSSSPTTSTGPDERDKVKASTASTASSTATTTTSTAPDEFEIATDKTPIPDVMYSDNRPERRKFGVDDNF